MLLSKQMVKNNYYGRINEIKNKHQIGDEMTVKVNRNGQERDITITLDEQP